MQSFHIDNKTGLIYMTQAYLDGYKLTKLKSNGEFISQMYVGKIGNEFLYTNINTHGQKQHLA